MDPKYLQTEGTYQLIVCPPLTLPLSENGKERKRERLTKKGMDTPLPHLKIGNTILQGQVTPLIGTEIILGLIRSMSPRSCFLSFLLHNLFFSQDSIESQERAMES